MAYDRNSNVSATAAVTCTYKFPGTIATHPQAGTAGRINPNRANRSAMSSLTTLTARFEAHQTTVTSQMALKEEPWQGASKQGSGLR